jgi:hypothetical protein
MRKKRSPGAKAKSFWGRGLSGSADDGQNGASLRKARADDLAERGADSAYLTDPAGVRDYADTDVAQKQGSHEIRGTRDPDAA